MLQSYRFPAHRTSAGRWGRAASAALVGVVTIAVQAVADPALASGNLPNVPTDLTIDSCYAACASPAVVRSGTPQIRATVSDPDGGSLVAEYEVYDNARATLLVTSGTTVSGVPSGYSRPWTVAPVAGGTLANGTYHWRARACDSTSCGGYSGWFTFTIDTSIPSSPLVSGDPYRERPTGTWNGGVGQEGSFTFQQDGPVQAYEYVYQLNGGTPVTVPAGEPQEQLLSPNQRQVGDSLKGFTAGPDTVISRSTARGHRDTSSLQVTPAASGTASDTYATVGGDQGDLRLDMQPGHRYWITGWVYVPSATGLDPNGVLGPRLYAAYRDNGAYVATRSNQPQVLDTWQRLSVVLTVPATATEAYVRLYDGYAAGSGKSVFWDDLSAREVIGTTTVEKIAPRKDGYNSLSVQARTVAGATSAPRVYDFMVNSSDPGRKWLLDENTGTVAASQPDDRPATFSPTGVTWSAPGPIGVASVALDGTGDLTTASPVLDTTAPAGFTVAAWVRLSDLSTSRTALAQDGANTSMFRLGFRTDVDVNGDGTTDPAWCFTLRSSDAASARSSAACSTDFVAADQWVSLVGIHNPIDGRIQLYVNGGPDLGGSIAAVDYYNAWSANGPLSIGRALDGGPTQRWAGGIDHVHAAGRMWSDTEISRFSLQ